MRSATRSAAFFDPFSRMSASWAAGRRGRRKGAGEGATPAHSCKDAPLHVVCPVTRRPPCQTLPYIRKKDVWKKTDRRLLSRPSSFWTYFYSAVFFGRLFIRLSFLGRLYLRPSFLDACSIRRLLPWPAITAFPLIAGQQACFLDVSFGRLYFGRLLIRPSFVGRLFIRLSLFWTSFYSTVFFSGRLLFGVFIFTAFFGNVGYPPCYTLFALVHIVRSVTHCPPCYTLSAPLHIIRPVSHVHGRCDYKRGGVILF